MSLRISVGCLLFALVVTPRPGTGADEPKKTGEVSATDLQLEVEVLRTLYYLKATPEQAQALLKFANETPGKAKKRKAAKVSAEYKQLLADLRDALAEDDEEQVDTLEDQLEALNITENPELDDHVKITDAARKRAPEVLRSFRAHQLATFIGSHADFTPDPQDKLLDALGKVRRWQLIEWKEKRDDLADEIGMLVGGVDQKKAAKAREETVELLARARTLKTDEFESKREELEREAKRVADKAGPMEVLRNLAENAIAEMLSNPRLESALNARAK